MVNRLQHSNFDLSFNDGTCTSFSVYSITSYVSMVKYFNTVVDRAALLYKIRPV